MNKAAGNWKIARYGDYDSSLWRGFYNIMKLRSKGDNSYTFECKDFHTKQDKILELKMSGLLEAVDQAFKAMKSPKDIFFLDMDDKGKWEVVNEYRLKEL